MFHLNTRIAPRDLHVPRPGLVPEVRQIGPKNIGMMQPNENKYEYAKQVDPYLILLIIIMNLEEEHLL